MFIPKEVFRDLLAFYQSYSINASLIDKHSAETIGKKTSIKIDGRNFDLVTLKFVRGYMSASRGFSLSPTISKKGKKSHPTIQFNYVIKDMGNISEDDIRVEMNEEKTGFVSKKLVNIEWEGGRLAGLLNGDAGLKQKILTMGTTLLRVEPDRKNDIVSIIHRKKIDMIAESSGIFLKIWKNRAENLPSIETLDIIDKIAEHVNLIINRRGMEKKEIKIITKTIKCPSCGKTTQVQGGIGTRVTVICPKCNTKGVFQFR